MMKELSAEQAKTEKRGWNYVNNVKDLAGKLDETEDTRKAGKVNEDLYPSFGDRLETALASLEEEIMTKENERIKAENEARNDRIKKGEIKELNAIKERENQRKRRKEEKERARKSKEKEKEMKEAENDEKIEGAQNEAEEEENKNADKELKSKMSEKERQAMVSKRLSSGSSSDGKFPKNKNDKEKEKRRELTNKGSRKGSAYKKRATFDETARKEGKGYSSTAIPLLG